MKFRRYKIVRTLIIIAIVAVVLKIVSLTGNNAVNNVLNTIFTPVESVFVKLTNPIREHFILLSEVKDYKSENERLTKEINELKIVNRDTKSYIEENNRLKDLLDLQSEQENMTTVAARVVAKDFDDGVISIKINKGKNAGIGMGDPVITVNGLVGSISSIGTNWANVTALADPKSAVGAMFTRNGDVGVCEGDWDLARKSQCRIEYISQYSSVSEGDILVTSGLSDLYPQGLMIGKISEINVNAVGEIENAIVDLSVKPESLFEVLVVTDFKRSINTENENANDEVDKSDKDEKAE